MILRRITFERYGCFGSAEFEFRRGMNLISGGNESGKSLLLAALPATLFGVEHGSRLRSWGETLNCRATLLFEGDHGGVRLTRDLENNLVRLEESAADGSWRECFAGKVPPVAETPERVEYFEHLERLFALRGEPLLRVLLDAAHADAALTADGRLAEGIVAEDTGGISLAASAAAIVDSVQRQQEIAALEAELAADREDYHKGKDYLAWIRKRWEREEKESSAVVKGAAGKSTKGEAPLERKRDELLAKLREQGLPERLPANLPTMFETAEGLRQELAALQLELTPLQRRMPTIIMPGVIWPLLATLVCVAAPGAAFWQKLPWWLPLSAGGGVVLLLMWGVFLVRLNRGRTERDLLEQQIQAVEIKRADALTRQADLAEQFESYGLPSVPVEMVKLEQLCRRNGELISQYREVCAQLGGDIAIAPVTGEGKGKDRHLRPEELPDAEQRLVELGESLRRREARLAALLDGSAVVPDVVPTSKLWPIWTEHDLLQVISQHLERLTAGRHREIRLDEGRLLLEATPGRWAAPSSCSQGTMEALVLAVRLACAQMSGGLLLLAIDDLPAHLDAKRQQAALRDLERFAADHQLLLASCDEELARRAVRERWHVVKFKQTATERAYTKEVDEDAGQLYLL